MRLIKLQNSYRNAYIYFIQFHSIFRYIVIQYVLDHICVKWTFSETKQLFFMTKLQFAWRISNTQRRTMQMKRKIKLKFFFVFIINNQDSAQNTRASLIIIPNKWKKFFLLHLLFKRTILSSLCVAWMANSWFFLENKIRRTVEL